MILLKVSFDKKLFEKELKKSLKVLVDKEIEDLRNWCYDKFSATYHAILNNVFTEKAVGITSN